MLSGAAMLTVAVEHDWGDGNVLEAGWAYVELELTEEGAMLFVGDGKEEVGVELFIMMLEGGWFVKGGV